MGSGKVIRRRVVLGVFLSLATVLGVGNGAAQTSVSPWTAWLGCWEPISVASEAGNGPPTATDAAMLCVMPLAEPSAVELVTIDSGSETDRVQLTASGERIMVERDGCSGWESVEASTDGERIYRFSEFDCGGQFPRRTSSVMGFVGSGEWVDVQGVSVGDFTDVRVARYRLTTPTPEAALTLDGRILQIDAARTAASARVGFAEVVDAVERVDAAVVEGWLIERNQGFELDAAGLRELADAGVPDRVIDLMVALSFPQVFAIDRSAREGERLETEPVALGTDSPRFFSTRGFERFYDPYYGYGYDYDPFYTYGRYSRYGNWYGPPVIIIREPVVDGGEPPQQERGRPRLVNGRGFSRGGNNDSANSGGGSRDSGSSASTGSSASSGTSSGGDSAPRRTAKPRSAE